MHTPYTDHSTNNNNDRTSPCHGRHHPEYAPHLPTSTITTTELSLGGELSRLVAVAATTAATLGYDVGIMAAAILPLEAEFQLSSFQKELAMGSLNFVAAAGALLGGTVADVNGRKETLKLTCGLFLVGTLFMALAPTYGMLLVGRIVTGLGVGVAFVVAPVFISEVAPSHRRGELNTVFDVAINGGILLGYVVGFLVQMILPDNWRAMLGLGVVLPLIVVALVASLPESPRWLVLVQRNQEALQALERLGYSQLEANETIQAITVELEQQQQQLDVSAPRRARKYWYSVPPGHWLALQLGFWQQISGTETVLYYSADFLARAGLESATQRLLGNVGVGICKLVPELFAMHYVDRIGRRPLLIASAASLLVTIVLIAIAFGRNWSPAVVVALLCAIMASFSAGVGPFTFLCASENLALHERASGMTLCAAINRCTSGLVALTAVSLSDWLGDDGLFSLYSVAAVGSLIFYAKGVPETSGATLEELTAARNNNSGGQGHPTSLPDEQMALSTVDAGEIEESRFT